METTTLIMVFAGVAGIAGFVALAYVVFGGAGGRQTQIPKLPGNRDLSQGP